MSDRHTGGCHCGAVRFSFAMPEEPLIRRCNCSICAMKGIVMLDVPKSVVEVTQGKEALTTYSFGSGVAKHHFCSQCGIHVLQELRSEPENCAVSLACVDDMSIYDLDETLVFDGQNHPEDTGEYSYAGALKFQRFDTEGRFERLVWDICVRLGFCGSAVEGDVRHVWDRVPKEGEYTADQFARDAIWAEQAHGANDSVEQIKRWTDWMLQAFVEHMGTESVDAAELHPETKKGGPAGPPF